MLDEKDFLIMGALENNADLTTKKLAFKLGMPQTTVHNRIKRLREIGVIKKYVAILDAKKLGKMLSAYVLIDIDYDLHYTIVRKLMAMPYVTDISAITGTNDLIIKVRVKDAEELGELVLQKLRSMGVRRTETLMELETVK